METLHDLNPQIEAIARQITEAAAAAGRSGVTVWELKLRLKTPLARLYMAVGLLSKEGAVRVAPEQLTYRVHAVEPSTGREGAAPAGYADPEPGAIAKGVP